MRVTGTDSPGNLRWSAVSAAGSQRFSGEPDRVVVRAGAVTRWRLGDVGGSMDRERRQPARSGPRTTGEAPVGGGRSDPVQVRGVPRRSVRPGDRRIERMPITLFEQSMPRSRPAA